MPILTNRWVVLALLFFARASMAMQFQSIPPISTLLVEELGFNFTQIGLLIGLWMLPGVFIALPGGLLGQRFGDKIVVIAGLGLQVTGALIVFRILQQRWLAEEPGQLLETTTWFKQFSNAVNKISSTEILLKIRRR